MASYPSSLGHVDWCQPGYLGYHDRHCKPNNSWPTYMYRIMRLAERREQVARNIELLKLEWAYALVNYNDVFMLCIGFCQSQRKIVCFWSKMKRFPGFYSIYLCKNENYQRYRAAYFKSLTLPTWSQLLPRIQEKADGKRLWQCGYEFLSIHC